jgi:hypothetical protein
MKIVDIQFHANPISYWRNVIGVLSNTSNISNIIISGKSAKLWPKKMIAVSVEQTIVQNTPFK